jgi:hypothetical protein
MGVKTGSLVNCSPSNNGDNCFYFLTSWQMIYKATSFMVFPGDDLHTDKSLNYISILKGSTQLQNKIIASIYSGSMVSLNN